MYRVIHKSLGVSDLCGTVAGMVVVKGNIPTEGETLKFLSYLTGARYILSAVSFLVVVKPSSEVPEGLMNYPVFNFFEVQNIYPESKRNFHIKISIKPV
jgi:hypothetical protein